LIFKDIFIANALALEKEYLYCFEHLCGPQTAHGTINFNQVVKVLFQVKSFALVTKQTSNNRKNSALTTRLALLSHQNGAVS
jgi:hypothetical protein